MKKLCLLLIIAIGLVACEGDRGPQGPPGEPGVNIVGTTVELNVSFDNQNEFYYEFINDGIEVLESDAVLVYRSEEFIEDSTGPIDVWKLMPQTIYFDDGSELVYGYDHTFIDVRIFLDGSVNLNNIAPEYYQNQLFRIVVVPSDFANDPNNDLTTYNNLLNELDNQDFQLETIQ